MSNTKKSVKRLPRVIAARDLMSVTGGAGLGSIRDLTTVGMAPQGPKKPSWGQGGLGGPTIGYFPTGPRNPNSTK